MASSPLLFDLTGHGAVVLAGKDRASFLHGLVTNDIKKLTPGTGCAAAFLTPKGKLLADCVVLCQEDRLEIDCEPELSGKIEDLLRKYLVFNDVQIGNETEANHVFHLTGDSPGDTVEDLLRRGMEGMGLGEPPSIPQQAHHHAAFPGAAAGRAIRIVRENRTGVPGYDVRCPSSLSEEIRRAFLSAGARQASDGRQGEPADRGRHSALGLRADRGRPARRGGAARARVHLRDQGVLRRSGDRGPHQDVRPRESEPRSAASRRGSPPIRQRDPLRRREGRCRDERDTRARLRAGDRPRIRETRAGRARHPALGPDKGRRSLRDRVVAARCLSPGLVRARRPGDRRSSRGPVLFRDVPGLREARARRDAPDGARRDARRGGRGRPHAPRALSRARRARTRRARPPQAPRPVAVRHRGEPNAVRERARPHDRDERDALHRDRARLHDAHRRAVRARPPVPAADAWGSHRSRGTPDASRRDPPRLQRPDARRESPDSRERALPTPSFSSFPATSSPGGPRPP